MGTTPYLQEYDAQESQRERELVLKDREVAAKEGELEVRRLELKLKEQEFQSSRWHNPLVVAILAAALTGAASVGVAFWNSEKESRLAQLKFEQSRKDEQDKRLSNAVSELTKQLARGYQKQAWLLWTILESPERVSDAAIAEYDSAMKEILPQLIASHISVANENRTLFFKLAPLIRELSDMDADLTKGVIKRNFALADHAAEFRDLQLKLQRVSASVGRRISGAYLGVEANDGVLSVPNPPTMPQTRTITCDSVVPSDCAKSLSGAPPSVDNDTTAAGGSAAAARAFASSAPRDVLPRRNSTK